MVDLRVTCDVGPPPTLFPLKEREKLAPPPRGGAEEAPVAQSHCRREGVAGACAAVVAVFSAC